jgi:hypothetical protein
VWLHRKPRKVCRDSLGVKAHVASNGVRWDTWNGMSNEMWVLMQCYEESSVCSVMQCS